MTARTSLSDPLRIDAIPVPGAAGVLGITFAPGKRDPHGRSGAWARDLGTDLAAIRAWGAERLVTLLEPHEFDVLAIAALPDRARADGLAWHHLPIRDVDIPDERFERRWRYAGPQLRAVLARGGRVVVHCRGGLGRAGLVAARLLVEFGLAPDDAIARVRAARPGAIETAEQERHVRALRPSAPALHAQDRFVGCLLGGALGDAFGYPVEFDSLDTIHRRHGAAGLRQPVLERGALVVSDDTQMTLFTALAAVQASGGAGEELVASLRTQYLHWLDTQHGPIPGGNVGWLARDRAMRTRRAPGLTCLSALEGGGQGTPEAPANDSKGCGGVMRVAPLAFLPDLDLALAFDRGARAAAITHGHPTGYLASGALVGLLWLIRHGWSIARAAREVAALVRGLPHGDETGAAMDHALALAATSNAQDHASVVRSLGEGWVAEEALAIGLYAAIAGDGFVDGVAIAANHSGDSDSTASIAGQILGTTLGCAALPLHWIEALDVLEPLLRVAESFVDAHLSRAVVQG
jgi:ADP-ribosylglycohydrolase/protein-tyrosine phosphatase